MSEPDWRAIEPADGRPEDEPAVVELLAETTTLALATASPGGRPFATPVFFAPDENLGLIFFSDPDTLHVQHVLERLQAAATIYPATGDWTQIRGLQVAGRVERILPGDAWEQAWDAYVRKFPFVADLRPLVDASWLLILVPSWIRLIDNRRGFGFKLEWTRGTDVDALGDEVGQG